VNTKGIKLPYRPITLIILDGWGINPRTDGNAIAQARKPNWDELTARYPHTSLGASGERVGLPPGQMGNSEVGHTNIGAGRIVDQDLVRISKAIRSGEFFRNPVLLQAMAKAKSAQLHLMGLVSDGGVHSSIEHLFALLELAKREKVERVYVHAFLDGRDAPPTSGLGYIQQLEDFIARLGTGRIATVMGRYYAMDRDKRWDRTQKAYLAMVTGETVRTSEAPRYFATAAEAVEYGYKHGETDEFLLPSVIGSLGKGGKLVAPTTLIRDQDVVIFFNFRADRARQLTRAFIQKDFSEFERKVHPNLSMFVSMTLYDETFDIPVAFKPVELHKIMGELVSQAGLVQLRIAETEKYAHVTYFFNGGEEKPFPNEDRCLIPSQKVATYDLKPEMSAYEITREVVRRINSGRYDFIVLNYANPDMVGHTGIMEAAVRAIEVTDECIGTTTRATLQQGGITVITADHGNAEQMLDYETGQPHTAHTTNPVPFILVGEKYRGVSLAEEGILADVAPTLLEIMKFPQPSEMTGKSLIRR
jgi:2,3-bisphosphoglycerate-independent phosphoglycerate mutase